MTPSSRHDLLGDLSRIFDAVPSEALTLHTDTSRIGLVGEIGPREQMLSDYLSIILEAAGDRTLLFPTFNYDFCKTGRFAVRSDPCQVGVLNEYARCLYPRERSRTPVFNFCFINNEQFSLEESINPFAAESTFGEMANHRAGVVFLGANFGTNTFIHHVEELANIGYRYIKQFPGEIVDGDDRKETVLNYRVRPLVDMAAVYDWKRLQADLLDKGVLTRYPFGRGWVHMFQADLLREYWLEAVKRDELYLLGPQSRQVAEELYRRFGRPLRVEALEGEQETVSDDEQMDQGARLEP